MTLDLQTCSRARLARDPRFDGKFFIAVRTSRVYCRTICPARSCKEENVRYYATAAAAAEAGFRPCLRCRPECSPGTPAWLGASTTVARALRLIAESGLAEGGVEALAGRLGIGDRHLRRLFLEHLGASPNAVAQTRRLHFAKKLIDETTLSMSAIAQAAGYGSVRRFNAAFRKTYQRTPTHIRNLSRRPEPASSGDYVFRLRYRPPYAWDAMLAFFAGRATPGVESVADGVYRRSISWNGDPGWLEIALDPDMHSLIARVHVGDPAALFPIVERIRAIFDLNADWSVIADGLSHDRSLAARIGALPGLRMPGCWDGFELGVRAILGQQITVKGATTLAGRLAAAYGQRIDGPDGITHLSPTPEALAEANMNGLGITTTRIATIRSFARAVAEGVIDFNHSPDPVDFAAQLDDLPGIGPWTAQYIAMRALREPDAFPRADLGLLRALALKNPRDLERRAEAWRPWRAYAVMYLWNVAGGG